RDDDPLLPPRSCDLVLVVNTYHHFPGGPRYLRRLRRLLRPRGQLVNVDFHRRETPVGPPIERRIARETFLRDARRAGLRLLREISFLPYQYCLVLDPRSSPGDPRHVTDPGGEEPRYGRRTIRRRRKHPGGPPGPPRAEPALLERGHEGAQQPQGRPGEVLSRRRQQAVSGGGRAPR